MDRASLTPVLDLYSRGPPVGQDPKLIGVCFCSVVHLDGSDGSRGANRDPCSTSDFRLCGRGLDPEDESCCGLTDWEDPGVTG